MFLRKIIRMFFKKYRILLEKLLKRKFLNKFKNFKRKNSEFLQFCRKMFEVFKFVVVLCLKTPFRIQEKNVLIFENLKIS